MLRLLPDPAVPPPAEPAMTDLLRRVAASVRQDLARAVGFTLANTVAGSVWMPRVVRYVLYRLLGMDVRTPKVAWNTTFLGRDVHVGRNAFINWGVVFEGGPITIGENTMVGQQVAFITADHPRDEHGRPDLRYRPRPIEVGADCWLGARVTVLGGVRIADGCIIGAGSVVTRDLPEPGVYAGAPARLVKALGTDAPVAPVTPGSRPDRGSR